MDHRLPAPGPDDDRPAPPGSGAGPGPGAERTLGFCVEVGSETLREALMHVGTRAGFALHRTLGPDTCHVVDEPKATVGSVIAQTSVLVVEPTPCGAHAGMKALAAGSVCAVISSERPKDLAQALTFVRNGWALAPLDLVDTASRMPDLSERQTVIVGAILAGQPTSEIAKGLYLSDASVKRELARLFKSFGVDNRLELAAFGASLGFRPRRISP
jgi:DNA-binding CsgD family transcriptional regulator